MSPQSPTNGTPEYWIDVCDRALAICDEEERFCKQYGKTIPEWVKIRRKQYQDFRQEWVTKRG